MGFDLALLPNFIHHFDYPTNVSLLKKTREALAPTGQVAIVEFVPNEDRVSPPDGALFAMRMLGTTPSGDAYTFTEIERMLRGPDSEGASGESGSRAPAAYSCFSRRLIRKLHATLSALNSRRLLTGSLRPALD